MEEGMSGCLYDQLDLVIAEVDLLISWAVADAEHSRKNDADETAEDDKRRLRLLHQARELLMQCYR
jgi:hypothetical protein